MELKNSNIKKYKSQEYLQYYNINRDLIKHFPDCNFFVVPTTLKGIGKSYSIWNTRLIPDVNNINNPLGSLVIRWSKDELDLLVFNLKSNPSDLENKLKFPIKWTSFKGMHVLQNATTEQPIFYFVTPTQFKIIKGMTINGKLPIKNVYWDEFLLPDGIYKKPKQTLDSFWQLLGSLFREEEYYVFMASNNTDPNNPFLWYLFEEMGWPDYGETIVNHDAGVVIDSPLFNDFLITKYNNSRFEKNARMNKEIHKQLFGAGRLNDSLYSNQELIIFNLDISANFKFAIQIGLDKYGFYTFTPDQVNWFMYIIPVKDKRASFWAGDLRTEMETGLKMVPDHIIKTLKNYLKNTKIRFRDGKTMNNIITWLERYREDTKIIDWTKGI